MTVTMDVADLVIWCQYLTALRVLLQMNKLILEN